MKRHQEEKGEKFRPRFLPNFLVLTVLSFGIYIAIIVCEEWPNVDWYGVVRILAMGAILCFLCAWSPVYRFKVYVCREGIWCSNVFGKYDFVEWHEIKVVNFLNLLLQHWFYFQKNLRGRRIWFLTDLVNFERFRDLVTTYAGRTHPLAKALWQLK
ncbi:MAG: hypothetical protein ACFFCW_23435 [Candidatus Hodarchaeota archaeon]